MKFNLPQHVNFVLDTLENNGHKAYIVGGCVRDLLCGKVPHDYDITTSALPHETQSLFKKTIDTGIKHGTVTVMLGSEQIEVTTFRTESVYKDSRHPENVSFVHDVNYDLARRDFTVNAIGYNNTDGLIDLFGGIGDIENKVLRAVGDAETRFSEDALRILRLFRFAATLEFEIEENTFDAAIKCAQLLKNISAERIFSEISKIATGNNITVISPLLQTNALSDYAIKNGDLSKLKNLKNHGDLSVFALLYHTSTDLQKTLDKFKCSNYFKNYCLKLVDLLSNGINCDKISIKNALKLNGPEIFYDCLTYFHNVLDVDISNHQLLLNDVLSSNEPYKVSQLDISGDDILALGFLGKEIGKKLDFLLDQVIKDPSLNTREQLLNLIM